jgi:predicted small lipoprotein YifL
MFRILLIVTVLAAITACGKAPESPPAHPAVKVADTQEVTAEQVKSDVVGRVIRISDAAGKGPADEWTFEAQEFKQAQILESRRAGNELTLVIHMTTRNVPKPDESDVQVSGKLRLRYVLKDGKWTLDGIENVNFQYSIGVAT